jgi:hypothetical protein
MTEQTRFATYRSQETAVTYYQGAGYVVRHEQYPHTDFTPNGPVTRQGHAFYVGARQGLDSPEGSGFAYWRYSRPDTEPEWTYSPQAWLDE